MSASETGDPRVPKLITALLVVAAGTAATLHAAAQSTTAFAEMSLEDLLNVKVSVASRTDDEVRDAPSSVTVFTYEEMMNMGVGSVQELLNFVPGFQTTLDVEQGAAYRIAARGRSTALSESVLFLINGQRLNDLYTGGVSILNRLLTVGNIKQVEVIRGPGSALFGSNAFLGIVNIVTLHEVNDVTVSAGNLDSRAAALNLSRELPDELSISAFLGAFSDSGYRFKEQTDLFGLTSDTTDPVRGIDITSTVKYRRLTVFARHMERTREDFLVFGGLGNGINRESTRQSSLTARYRLVERNRLQLDLGANYGDDRWRSTAVILPRGIELAPGLALEQQMTGGPLLASDSTSVSADLRYQVAEANTLIGGLSYERSGISDVANLNNHNPITLEYQGRLVEWRDQGNFNEERSRSIWGLYLQDRHSFSDRLVATAGVRYDEYSDFGGALSPRAALIYRTPFSSSLKLMYGEAFRAPNFLELYDRNNPVDFGNPELDPEEVRTWELAYVQTWHDTQLQLTYFDSSFDNLIVLGEPVEHAENPFGSPTFYNAGQLTTRGFELELAGSPIESMLVRASFTQLLDDDELLVAGTTASLAVNYRIRDTNLNLNGIYHDAVQQLGLGSYVLLNSKLQLLVTPDMWVFVNIRNLLDEQYRTVSSVLAQGVPNRGRTYSVGIRLGH